MGDTASGRDLYSRKIEIEDCSWEQVYHLDGVSTNLTGSSKLEKILE